MEAPTEIFFKTTQEVARTSETSSKVKKQGKKTKTKLGEEEGDGFPIHSGHKKRNKENQKNYTSCSNHDSILGKYFFLALHRSCLK
jgi:hypothetical protein